MDMELISRNAQFYVPDQTDPGSALQRTTHLGIGAHQDDLEIMAFHGIAECYNEPSRWFGGITCTDGGDTPSSKEFSLKKPADKALRLSRQEEQNQAAAVGQYSFMLQLNYSSKSIKNPASNALQKDLCHIISKIRPNIIYTHNPADKHLTHIAVFFSVIKALRELNPAVRPEQVYGCESWRTLDWLEDPDKIPLDVSQRNQLALSLLRVFDSQIRGGKKYDQATIGRRRSNATFNKSHEKDQAKQIWYAMDLVPLIKEPFQDVKDFVLAHLHRFTDNVLNNLKKFE